MSCRPHPLLLFLYLALLFASSPALAGDLYYTGFDNFTVGNDTISGKDGWTGSSSHAGYGLSGVDSEAQHLVSGIGNAAFIGGNQTLLPASVTNRTVNVRRAFNIDPVALNQEVVQFHVTCGIKDSTYSGLATRRDNFEYAFYNYTPGGTNYLLAFIQFDNTTLDSSTQAPAQKIWRSSWNTTTARFDKVDTGVTFYYDVLMELELRINFRTNRWSASIDGLQIFSDVAFYTGSQTKNLGIVATQMQIANSAQVATQTLIAPGDNYMLFDDFAVRTDPVPDAFFYTMEHTTAGTMQLTWLTEALYKYQLQYTDDLTKPWKNDLPNSFATASTTGQSAVFTDYTAVGIPRRFYRILRTAP